MQYLVTSDESLRAGITAVRMAYNAGLPAEVQIGTNEEDGTPIMGPNPDLIATDEDYMIWVNKMAIRSYNTQLTGTPVPAPEPDGEVGGLVMAVTRKQGLKALLRANEPSIGLPAPVLESDILAMIGSMPEATPEQVQAKYDTLYEFQNAKTWQFDNPFTLGLQQMIGATDAQKRALFDLAATFTE